MSIKLDCSTENDDSQPGALTSFLALFSDLSRIKMIGQIWVLCHKWIKRLSSEGMYEVLEYETILEIKDKQGKIAILNKNEKVRYLQDNILAFQDQVWGDGKNLIDYGCKPGFAVDQYRSGYKTNILISLREVKSKGDIDDFNIEWSIKWGFLSKTSFWATEISHKTNHVGVKIIFPQTRPPLSMTLVERNRSKTTILGQAARMQLSDGRWALCWEKKQPRLYEQYILNWEW